jgi:hypothetical protein
MAIDLTLWLPKPKQKKANQQGESEPTIKAVPKPIGHLENLLRKLKNSTQTLIVRHAISRAERIRAIDGRAVPSGHEACSLENALIHVRSRCFYGGSFRNSRLRLVGVCGRKLSMPNLRGLCSIKKI